MLSLNEMIKALRVRDGMTQLEAAEKIDAVLKARSARYSNVASIRSAISQMEAPKNPRAIPANFREAMADVYDIPVEWFRRTWRDLRAFQATLDRHRAGPAPTRAPSLKQLGSAFRGACLPEAILNVDPLYDVASRAATMAKFVSDLQSKRPAVYVVEGLSGYGKSTFVHLAVNRLRRSKDTRLILEIRCSGRTAQEIAQQMSDLVASAERDLGRFSLEQTFQHIPSIIIFDDADRMASGLDDGGTPIAGAKLSEIFASAMSKQCDLKLILVMRSSAGTSGNLYSELSHLTGREREAAVRLGPLTNEDVALLLRNKLAMATNTAKRFAGSLGGDPIHISSFINVALDNKKLPIPLLALEAETIARNPHDESRIIELRPLLDSLRRRSRTAFLTAVVLTFAPNGIDLDTCRATVEQLLTDGVADFADGSYEHDTVPAVLGQILSEFTKSYRFQKELHSRVRSAFTVLIADGLGVDRLRLVHKRMAEAALEKLSAHSDKSSRSLNFQEYYSLLSHLMSLYQLATQSNKEKTFAYSKYETSEYLSSVDLSRIKELLASKERLLDRHEVANVSFSALMVSHVDREGTERVLSRQFGDFEQKLKILSMFTVGGNVATGVSFSPLPELTKPYAARLLLDVAVCAAQSGLIKIAHEAMAWRQKFQPSSVGKIQRAIESRLFDLSATTDLKLGNDIVDFNTESEHLNVYTTVLLREGKFETALPFIERYAERSESIFTQIRRRLAGGEQFSGKTRRHLNLLLIACRRLATKQAQIFLLAGERDKAERWFDTARQMEALKIAPASPDHPAGSAPSKIGQALLLTGETGRAYCTMLMHAGAPDGLDLAALHISSNLKKAEDNGRLYEVVDWMVLQASLERLRGDLAAATRTLKAAERRRAEPGVAISFASSVTLFIEQERQRVRQSGWRGISHRLASMQELAASSKHSLLSCDAALLLAESAPDPVLRIRWLFVARWAIDAGYGFRSVDVARIEADGPFDDLL